MVKLLKSVFKSIKRAIYNDPQVQRLAAKYPRFFPFIRKRITPDEKFGLHLTIGTIIAAFFVYLFFGILQDLIGRDPLILSDLRIINLVQILRDSFFSKVMLLITYMGNWHVVFLGVIIACLILALIKHWHYLIALIVSVSIGEFFILAVKNIIERPRPPLINVLRPENGFSFPSGHSFIALSFYGLIAYFLFRELKSKLLKTLSVIAGVTLILSIGFSRIYLGVHWPSDVLASYAAGTAWLTALVTTLEIRRKFNHRHYGPPYFKKSIVKILSAVLIIAWIFYLAYFFQTNPLQPPYPKVTAPQIYISQKDIPQKLFEYLPKTSEDITGQPMEPINIIIIGNQNKLNATFIKAGWNLADKITPTNLWLLLKATLFNQPYPQAPSTPSFWNTLPNDLAYVKDTPTHSIQKRHHIHFWKTSFILTDKQNNIWFATAHFDNSVKVRFGITLPIHNIDPIIDKERELIKDDLLKTGYVNSLSEFQIIEPTLGQNQTGDQFFTDGKTYVIFLK